MVQVRISLNAKWERRLRSMARDYDITLSDLFNEIAEWVLDQEKAFRKDLEAELPEEEEEEGEEEEEEEGEEEEEEETEEKEEESESED